MLVLEIAAGIVLGVLFLSFLPILMELIGSILAVLIAIAVLALVFFLFISYPNLLFLIAVVGLTAFGIYLYEESTADIKEIRELEIKIENRKLNGYEPLEEQAEELAQLKAMHEQKIKQKKSLIFFKRFSSKNNYKSEEERRKALGYDN